MFNSFFARETNLHILRLLKSKNYYKIHDNNDDDNNKDNNTNDNNNGNDDEDGDDDKNDYDNNNRDNIRAALTTHKLEWLEP